MARRRAMSYVDSALVVHGSEALTPECKAAELLARQLAKRASVRCAVIDDRSYDPHGWQALILVGHPDRHLVAAALMASHGVRRPNQVRPGPEGYVVRRVGRWHTPTVVIAGSDSRGCLYGVGAFLREVDLSHPGRVGIPDLGLSGAPASPIRGSDLKFWHEGRVADLGMGLWSLEQWEEQIADLALWGVNLIRRRLFNSPFDTWLDEHELMIEDGSGKIGWEMEKQINQLIHGYGLQVGICYPPNTIASAAARDEWHPGSPWRRLACPSLPAARDRILYERLQIFKELEHIDHLFIPPYEAGSCNCESCRPWIATYLELACDTAKHLHRYHPNAQVWLSNQGLSSGENEWLWEVLARERPDWFRVIQFGPTLEGLPGYVGPAASGVPRAGPVQRHYPALSTLARTLQETARRVPVHYTLVLGPDVTHTFQPEYGLEHTDPALLWLHTYESPFARPLGYHEVFRATAAASAGAMLYSEGLYDDLNKALWAGWTWSPNLSPWDATLAYARYWFGESAARAVAEAILLSEANWENPLLGNDQVEQVVLQLDRAEMHIPPHLQEGNWRWTLWRLRGLLDLLAQQKLRLADETRQVVHALLSEALTRPDELVEGVQAACDLLDLQQREARLGWLREEIRDLNDLLHYQIGLRLPAVANLDAELTNLGWELAQLRKALAAHASGASSDLKGLRRAIALCLNYENPGPGGFYDDCGHIGRDPHFVAGHRIPGAHGLDPINRLSANTFAAGFGEAEDVVFAYRDLDPEASYRVRLTLVCPEEESGRAQLAPAAPTTGVGSRSGAAQRLYASGFLVHGNLRLPGRVAQQFTFDLPRQSYSDGRLELRFVRAAAGLMVAVSEIWLIQVPDRARG
jgi:ribosomal protein L29